MSKTTNSNRAVACVRFVWLWVRQCFCFHRFDIRDLIGRSTPDGCVTWPCYKCNKIFVRQRGLDVLDHGQIGDKPNVKNQDTLKPKT